MLDRQIFQNKDLVLKVSPNYGPNRFDPNKYKASLDALCGDRGRQKDIGCGNEIDRLKIREFTYDTTKQQIFR